MSKEMGVSAGKSDDFSTWYTDAITKSGMIEYTDVSGCLIYRPYSFAIWEKIQAFLNAEFKKLRVQNAYFPLFIPEHLLTKEADHVEGFAPEVAWVTHGGNSELSERLAIRPTSETIMYDAFSKWIRSHRDLPLLLNQWTNVVRWEFKHPQPFLRGREFLWQEGHTAHATKEGATMEAQTILEIYARCYEELLAVPCLTGRKSDKEKFAGAEYSLSCEILFPNGKAIQGCTSHHLGQNFAKAFDITYLDENEEKQHVWQNSWGFSTRSIGVMIGVHGDDNGLILPPKVAPIPVVVVPLLFSKNPEGSEKARKAATELAEKNGWHLDDRENLSPGFKFNEWELKGVPVRVEIGPRDIENHVVTVVRRDTGEKEQIALEGVANKITSILEDIQQGLFSRAKQHLESSIIDVKTLDELKAVIEKGKIGRAPWCGSQESEEQIKEATGAKSLNMIEGSGVCFVSGESAKFMATFAKSY